MMLAPRRDIHLLDLGFCLVMMFILVSLAAQYPPLAGKNAKSVRYHIGSVLRPSIASVVMAPCPHAPDDALQRVQQKRFECTLRNTIFPNADQE
ncbi:hypothetical protein ACEUA8_11815 [Aeromonas veronii]